MRPAVTSNNHFLGKRAWKAVEGRLFHLKRALQKKGTKSAKRHLKRVRGKQARFRRTTDHILSKQIVAGIKPGGTLVLENLTDIPMIFDYIEAMLAAGQVLAPPENLADHVYARYLPSPAGEPLTIDTGAAEDDNGLDRLDPVCLMDVDPATARWKSEYAGRMFAFCSPGCKKAFDRNPEEYLEEVGLGEACGVDLQPQ